MGLGRRPSALRRVEIPAVIGVFLVLRAFGLIASSPWWVLVVVVVGGSLLTDLAAWRWPHPEQGAQLWLRTATLAFAVAAVLATIGWPIAVGYVFVLAEGVRTTGSRSVRPALVCSLAGLVLGEVAAALDLAPNLIGQPESFGFLILGCIGLVIGALVIEGTTRAREEAERALHDSERRLRSLLTNASDLIVAFAPDGSTSYVSPATERALGVPPGGTFILSTEIVHPDDLGAAIELYATVMADPYALHSIEVRLRGPHQAWRWYEAWFSNRLDDPTVRGIVANLRDITERKQVEDQLTHDANHDSLTGLPNRAALFEQLRSAVAHPVFRGTQIAVLFVDVDRFKVVNDSLGHDAGDRLLVEVAERLRTCVRPGDAVSRLGGDEFTLLLTLLRTPAEAGQVAERVLQVLRVPVETADRPIFVTASVGIALADGASGCDPGDLLRRADLAMYAAKQRGRDRVEWHDNDLVPAIGTGIQIESELWRAVEQGELVVHFQPEVALDDGGLVAVEALVRWEHPDRGLVMPDAFIPLAEESNLIVAIDRHVLREACRRFASWPGRRNGHRTRVSVNLSPRFVHQPDVADDVLRVLDETGLAPDLLQLEITERTALSDRAHVATVLRNLREQGVHVAIDDFGKGYSALSYLRDLPVDVLKLDKSFIDAIGPVESGNAIARAVITMGHALGMRVTAEGVERADQAAQLASLGCDAAQGYHFARPMAPARLADVCVAGLPLVGTATPTPSATVVPFPVRRADTAG